MTKQDQSLSADAEADAIIEQLLARPGALTLNDLYRLALAAIRDAGESANGAEGRLFLKHTMIAIAAADDDEADALLARANGMEPDEISEHVSLDETAKRAAVAAAAGFHKAMQRTRRRLH